MRFIQRVLVLLGVLMLGPLAAQSQPMRYAWEVLSESPDRGIRHEDIFFVTPSTGWIVGFSGIFKTTDGGASWIEQSGPSLFRAAGFASEQIGWVGTLRDNAVLFETRDGGQTWQNITGRIKGPLPLGICGLWVVNEDLIYGVGIFSGPATLIKSTDGGQTWTATDMSPYAGTLVDVYFFDENTGIAVGSTSEEFQEGRAVVLRTTDGGVTWQVRHTSSDTEEWGWKISFPSPTTGYVALESVRRAKVLKTTDQGLTWEEILVPSNRRLQGIGFVTEDVGWVGGRGFTATTQDGGTTWTRADFGDGLNRFRFLSDSLGFAIGRRAHQLRRAAPTGTTGELAPLTAFSLEQNYPNPFEATTTIGYQLTAPGYVTLTLHDVLGRQVATLIDAYQVSGHHTLSWHGTNDAGRRLAPGVYLYRLQIGQAVRTQKLILLD